MTSRSTCPLLVKASLVDIEYPSLSPPRAGCHNNLVFMRPSLNTDGLCLQIYSISLLKKFLNIDIPVE